MTTPIVRGLTDTRTPGPMLGSEREVLDYFLDLYRDSLFLKIEDLDAEQLARRAVPPSTLSLVGIVRHLTEVEGYWVREVVQGRDDVPDYYCTRESPDGDFDLASAETAAQDVERYRREIDECREILRSHRSLDTPVAGRRHGRPLTLRWILNHLVEEYARHLGHMDLLREVIDRRTGF